MKPITGIVLATIFSAATFAATAKTVTMSPRNANENSVVGVAGPAPTGNKPVAPNDQSSAQPLRSKLKKAKIKSPPPMHDPN